MARIFFFFFFLMNQFGSDTKIDAGQNKSNRKSKNKP